MSSVVIAGDTSGSITLAAPAVAGTTTLTLPASTGNVVTDSATQTLTNKTLTSPTISGTVSGLTSASLPTGSVLQVVSTTKTSVFSTTSTSFVDVTGLSVSITPSSSSNKILVFVSCSMSADWDDRVQPLQLLRDSTAIGLSDQSGTSRIRTSGGAMMSQNVSDQSSQTNNVAFQYLDSPSTASSVTYKIQTRCGTGNTIYLGRTGDSTDDANRASYPATITVMEIKG